MRTCMHAGPGRAHTYTGSRLEAIAVGATVWDVSGPTPTEAVKPPPPNVLGEVRLHTRMRKKKYRYEKARQA